MSRGICEGCGADAFHGERPEEIRPAITAALNSAMAALVEVVVDAEERSTRPEELKA